MAGLSVVGVVAGLGWAGLCVVGVVAGLGWALLFDAGVVVCVCVCARVSM